MPLLDQPHEEGLTMAQQAARTRGILSQNNIQQAMAQHATGSSIIVPEQAPGPQAPQFRQPPVIPRFLPTDTLPEEAASDPQYRKGMGSLLAMSQPHLALKYGIVRGGRFISPQEIASGQMGGGSPALPHGNRPQRTSTEIINDLRQAVTAPPVKGQRDSVDDGPAPPVGIPRTEAEAAAQAAQGPGAASAQAGKAPIPAMMDASSDETEARAKKLLADMDDFDFERLRREMISDILKNPEQRKIVEARLAPLDIGELIMTNKIQQKVPILLKRFVPTFESMDTDTELRLKQLLVKEAKSIAVTEAYLLDKYAVMTTTAGTVAINGMPTPSMYDNNGDFNEDLFWEKFAWMLKRNIHMIASLGIHYAWFEQRVRKLFVADEGKDG
jgi:hypothetical protein